MFGFKSRKRKALEKRIRQAADDQYDREVEAARRVREERLRDDEMTTRHGRQAPVWFVVDGVRHREDEQ